MGKRILHICPRYWPAYGGAEIFATTVAQWTSAGGKNEIDVWTTDADEVDALWFPGRKKFTKLSEKKNGVNITRFKTTPFLMNNIFVNKAIRYILTHAPVKMLRILGTPPTCFGMWMQIFRKDLPKYDIVHVMAMPYHSLIYIARKIAKKTGAKLYLTPFTHLGVDKKDKFRRVYFDRAGLDGYQKADIIFYQTNPEKDAIIDFVKEHGKEIDTEKFVKVGLGVFPDKILGGNGNGFKRKFKIKDPIIFYVGAKVYVKGTFTLIKAMELLWKKEVNAKLVIAGNTSMEFEDFWKSRSALVKKNTINLDFVTDEQKIDIFDAGDIFCMVSKSESFGIVYLESWLYKKPVIGCNIEAVKEVITEGEDGFLIEFDDERKLAYKIEMLLGDEKTRKKLGESGYNKVMNNYTWEKKFKILEKYF